MVARTVRLGSVCRQDRVTVAIGSRADLKYIGLESIESTTGQFNIGDLSKTPEAPRANSFAFDTQHVLYGKLRPYLNKVAVPALKGKCSTEIIPLLPTAELDRHYLAYFLRSPRTVAAVAERCSGSRMPRADMDFVLSLAIPLPPIDEQAQIVDVLSRAESIIRLRREAQKKATELIPAIFVDMFGDPATNPRGWPVVQLGEVLAEPPVLGTMAKPSAEKREWLDLRVANIQRGSLNLDDEKWLDLSPQEIKRFALRNGDVILARAIGSLDHLGKAIVVEPDGKWTFDSHLMRIRVNREQLLPEMLTTYLETDGGRREFLSHTRRSAVQFNINGKEIRRVRLPIWPIELQRLFLRKLESVDSIVHQQSAALERAIAAFEALLARTFATNDG